jgi:hypothetical protein
MDLWTSLAGHHYLVVNYHGIVPDGTFKFWTASLDLIPFLSSTYATSIASVISTAIERHSKGNPNLLHAGNVSDRGANVHLAGALLTNTNDQLDCFNHGLKSVIDSLFGATALEVGLAVVASKDLIGMLLLIQQIRSHSDMRTFLLASQECKPPLVLLPDCQTRWEGKHAALKRFLALKGAIIATTKEFKREIQQFLADLGDTCPAGFLSKVYWKRLKDTYGILKVFRAVSRAAQSESGPTGSCVLKWTHDLLVMSKITSEDSKFLRTLKPIVKGALKSRFGKYLTTVTNYLKSSLFDTRTSWRLCTEYKIPLELVNAAWSEVW